MREVFPRKTRGQPLTAKHINDLSRAARAVGTPMPGSYMMSTVGANAAFPPFAQRTFVVLDAPEEVSDESSSSSSSTSSSSSSQSRSSSSSNGDYNFEPRPSIIYKIKPLYYDHTAEQWKLDTDHNFLDMDAGGVDQTFTEGDVVIAFWDEQRDAWIPIRTTGGLDIIRFEIVSVGGCETCRAIATVLSRPEGQSKVRFEDSNSQVRVYDFAGCWLNASEEDLIGLRGYAALLRGASLLECEPDPDEENTGRVQTRWEIISLCCSVNSCVSP